MVRTALRGRLYLRLLEHHLRADKSVVKGPVASRAAQRNSSNRAVEFGDAADARDAQLAAPQAIKPNHP